MKKQPTHEFLVDNIMTTDPVIQLTLLINQSLSTDIFPNKLVQNMDNFETPTSILIDLSKAFDTLNHDIMLYKLKFYGISGVALNFFSSYLTGRLQYVDYLENTSQVQSLPLHLLFLLDI